MNFVSSIALNFKDGFSAGFSSAANSLAGLRQSLDQLGQNSGMNRLAADLATQSASFSQFSSQLSGMIDQPSQLAGSFETSLKNIQVVSGATVGEMEVLKGELLSIGSQSLAGPQAVADAYNDIAGGITDASARMGALSASIAMAEAGQADLGVATGGMVSVMNAFGYSAEQAMGVSDVFTQTVGMGVGSMDEFVSAMSPIAGLTASVGVGFDELGSAMAFATSKGQTAAMAATQMKAAMTSLLNPNETMAVALKSVGIESGSAMLAEYGLAESLNIVKQALGGSQDAMTKALGSSEALQAAIALTADDYGAFATTFGSTMSGVTESARSIQLESFESKTARLEAVSQSLQMQIGTDVNKIKGFFVDMKSGFLLNVVSPLMNSPVGGTLTTIAAGASVGVQSLLNLGAGR
jgi:TP901 family phage tail tape measure protein